MLFAFGKDRCSTPHALNLSDRLYGTLKLSIKLRSGSRSPDGVNPFEFRGKYSVTL